MNDRPTYGVIASVLTGRLTIVLPDGRGFRVPESNVVAGDDGRKSLQEDTEVERVFPQKMRFDRLLEQIFVPQAVLDKLPEPT